MFVPAREIQEGDHLHDDNLLVARTVDSGYFVTVFDPFGAHVTFLAAQQVEVADRG